MTDAERIAALEQKVAALQDRLDWSLLAGQSLLAWINRIVHNPAMSDVLASLNSKEDTFQVQFERILRYVQQAIDSSFAEQGIEKQPRNPP